MQTRKPSVVLDVNKSEEIKVLYVANTFSVTKSMGPKYNIQKVPIK